jgi:hypothetical protein
VAAARGFAINGDQIEPVGPGLANPGGEGRRKQRRIDAVHEQGQPASAGRAMRVGQVVAQEAEVRFAPGRDRLVMVAVGHRAADHEKQHLPQRMRDAPGLARIVDDREMIEKRLETRLLPKHSIGKAHGGSESTAAHMESRFSQSVNRR